MRLLLPLLLCFSIYGANAQDLYFPPISTDPTWDTVDPASLGWCVDELPAFESYLESNGAFGVIILKDGKMAYEKYFNGVTFQSTLNWESASIAIGSLMANIAQAEGKLNLNDKASKVLGSGWSSAPAAKEDLILVKHLVNMTTGLKSTDPTCAAAACLQYSADAGTEFNFHYGVFKLLLDIIKTHPLYGNDINFATLQQDLLSTLRPPSMDGAWYDVGSKWVFRGSARSLARFGLITLAKGKWENKVVLDNPTYYDEIFNGNGNPNKSFANLWWQNSGSSYQLPGSAAVSGMLNPNAPASMTTSYGVGGQFIDVIPTQNMVVIRLGVDFMGNMDEVPLEMHREFWANASKFLCGVVDVEETPVVDESLAFPNPFENFITIYGKSNVETVRIFDAFGKKVVEVKGQKDLLVSHLPKGLYILEVTDHEQVRTVKKMIKQ